MFDSVLLPERFSGFSALHLRYSFLSFSRAAYITSPHPMTGRLRVLLLRQAVNAVPLRISTANIKLLPYINTLAHSCQHLFVFFKKIFVFLWRTQRPSGVIPDGLLQNIPFTGASALPAPAFDVRRGTADNRCATGRRDSGSTHPQESPPGPFASSHSRPASRARW